MRFGNELKVGVAIVLTALVAFIGIRFLAGLAVFGSGYELVAVFDDTEGLTSGNPVEVSGVQIGTVRSVALLPGARAAEVVLSITSDTDLPRGSIARVGGISALGNVGVTIEPGPLGAPPLTDGDTLLIRESSDLIGLVQNNAERLFGSVDTLVTGAAGTFSTVDDLLANPNSDLRATLAQLRGAATAANQLLASQRTQLAATHRQPPPDLGERRRADGRREHVRRGEHRLARRHDLPAQPRARERGREPRRLRLDFAPSSTSSSPSSTTARARSGSCSTTRRSTTISTPP